MPFKELVFFADAKRKVVKTHRRDYSAKSYGNFYTSLCLFIVFENFRICLILHADFFFFFSYMLKGRNYHSFSAIESQLAAFAWLVVFLSRNHVGPDEYFSSS